MDDAFIAVQEQIQFLQFIFLDVQFGEPEALQNDMYMLLFGLLRTVLASQLRS